MKSPECEGCPLLGCEGPVSSELNGKVGWDLEGECDVLFVSEAPGRHEIMQGHPFANPKGAGGILRQSLKYHKIDKFAILNYWRCRPTNNKLPDTGEPGAFCKRLLAEELHKWSPKIIVPLGAVGLNALVSEDMSIMKARGRLFSVNGTPVLAMLHPAYLLRNRAYWRDWELDMEKLRRFLDGKTDYVREKCVTKATSREQALQMLQELHTHKVLACDIETTSFNMPWQDGEIIAVAFAWSPSGAYSIPARFLVDGVQTELKSLMEDPNITWLWYNGIYDVQFFWAENIQARIDRDAMLEVHLHDERLNVHSLKKDAGIYLDAPNWEEKLLRFKIPNDTSVEAQQAWRDIPEDELCEYNGLDTIHTFNLSKVVRERVGERLCTYCDDLLTPAYNMLARARRVGIRVDVYKIQELRNTFVPVLQELETRLIEISGDSFFNPRSPVQKLQLLHKRKIWVPNTRKETLEEYVGDEVVDALLAYSEAHKMQSTYIEGIVDDISDDMRVHPDWRLPTETGRLRSSDPNILGMPRKAEETEHKWKRLIKEMFVADKGKLLANLDRRQSEVRVACFLSRDEVLANILRQGTDLHSNMAKLMYGENFTHEQRVWAKMVTFGLIYNREAPSLARQLKCIVREAQGIINRFFEQMPRLLEWKKALMQEALDNWQLTSYFGRIRRFGFVTYENKKDIENEAVNFPVSSVSSDINLISCVETMKQFGRYGVEILAPVHDSALMLIPGESILPDITALWESIPAKVLKTDLPFPCDVTIGSRWSDL